MVVSSSVARVEFGADGIRGIIGQYPLVPKGAVDIGYILGQFLRERGEHPVAVMGRDTRPSGDFLSGGLREGMLASGIDVIDLGVMTTPGVAYVTRRLKADLGVIVSASHNPFQYNGIKLVGPQGLRLEREDEIEIEIRCKDVPVEIPVAPPGEQADARHLVELYVEDHVQWCPAESLEGFRVVLDCANGAASRIARETFARLGAEPVVINDDMSGASINRACGSEHARMHPRDFAAMVQQHGMDYGFAFDGDGDRLVIVDSVGHVFDGDDLLFVLASFYQARDQLRDNMVVTTSARNAGLEISLGRMGIHLVRAGKGDKAVESAMWRGDYLLGGEQTGNIIVNDGHHTAADAIYTAVVVAGILVQERISLVERVSKLVKFPQVLASVRITQHVPLEQISALVQEKKRLLEKLGPGSRVETWYSSTEPGLLRVLVEGCGESTLEESEQAALSILHIVQQATLSQDKSAILLRASARSR